MLHDSRLEIVFRPHRHPAISAPVLVRSAGDYRVGPDWREATSVKWFHQVFWVVEGRGRFHADGCWQEAGAGDAFFYRPGEAHGLEPAEMPWRYLWMTLDGKASAEVLTDFGLDDRRYQAGQAPEALFREVISGLSESTPRGELRASGAAYGILAELSWTRRRLAEPTDLAERLRERIDRDFADPDTTVEALADVLGVHRSTVFRAFRRTHGLAPSTYLKRKRLQKGLALLGQSRMTVQEVALAVGFTDSNHFAKSIRRSTGHGPTAFRQREGQLDRRHRVLTGVRRRSHG